jgi:hypothetical protein
MPYLESHYALEKIAEVAIDNEVKKEVLFDDEAPWDYSHFQKLYADSGNNFTFLCKQIDNVGIIWDKNVSKLRNKFQYSTDSEELDKLDKK